MDTVKIKIVKADEGESYQNGDILEAVRDGYGWLITNCEHAPFDYYVAAYEAEEIEEEPEVKSFKVIKAGTHDFPIGSGVTPIYPPKTAKQNPYRYADTSKVKPICNYLYDEEVEEIGEEPEVIYVRVTRPVEYFKSYYEVGKAYPAKRHGNGFHLQRPGSSSFSCFAWDYEVEELKTKPTESFCLSKEYIIVEENSSKFTVGDIVKPYFIHSYGGARANTAYTDYTTVNTVCSTWVLEIVQDPIEDQESTIDYSESESELAGIDATLEERGERYGEFDEHARITQNIKRAMQDSPNWNDLPDYQKEALEMNAHKIGRILNGDPMYVDSWHDLVGYSKLVEDILEKSDES